MRQADEQAIFEAARRIDSPEARQAYLRQSCGEDEPLRERVTSLLAAFAANDGFLESPPPGVRLSATLDCLYGEKAGRLVGSYKLLEQIGEGGFGVVFLAEQERPVRRKVALKIIKPGMDTRQVIARFEAERQALALMDHPNIAKVLDAGMVGSVCRTEPESGSESTAAGPARQAGPTGRPYFVMELVQGVPITEYCDQCNLTTRERLEQFIMVCQAVQHAHQKGIIHRDIKPSNVLVTIQYGKAAPKIIDFGVAKAINQQLTEHTLATGFSQIIGTPLYMSPEQAELSPLGVDTRTDVYSLGVLLYELLTGTTPFEKERLKSASFDELRRIIREEEPPRPSARLCALSLQNKAALRETVALATTIAQRRRTEPHRLAHHLRGELDWIVMKCLEKDRSRRYESASALARDIERYLQDEPVQACPPSAVYRLGKFLRRNRGPALAAGIVLAALIAGSVAATWGLLSALAERDEKVVALAAAETNLRKATQVVDTFLTEVSESELAENPELEPLRNNLLQAALHYYEGFVQQESDNPALQAELVAACMRISYLAYTLDPESDWLTPAEKAFDTMAELLQKNPPLSSLESLQHGIGRPSGASAYMRRPTEILRIFKKGTRVWRQLVKQYPEVLGFQLDLATLISATAGAHKLNGEPAEALSAKRECCELLQQLARTYPNDPRASADLAIALATLARAEGLAGNEAEAKAAGQASINLANELTRTHRDKPVYREILAWVQWGAAEVHEHFGELRLAAQYYRERVDRFGQLAQEFPAVPRYEHELLYTLSVLGEVLWAAEQYDEAAEVFQKVKALGQKLRPDDSHGQCLYAWFLSNCPDQEFRNAMEALKVSVALVDRQPAIGDYWFARGAAKYWIGELEGAKQDLESGLKLPHEPLCTARLILPMVYWRLGEQQKARNSYHAAFEWLNKRHLRYAEFRRLGAEAAKLLGEPLPESYKPLTARDAQPTTSDGENQPTHD
jgi:serine/threonine protein kinase/tetratricopeptide (TPR) repeat protein